jgi:hydrogenase maturation factor
MNLITGTLEEIYVDSGIVKGKVRVGGAFIRVPLMLLMDARIGDEIVVSSGVAISRVGEPQTELTLAEN